MLSALVGGTCRRFTPCLENNCAKLFFARQPELCQILTNCENFWLNDGKEEVYSFSTSPNLRQRTTVLNADVPNVMNITL